MQKKFKPLEVPRPRQWNMQCSCVYIYICRYQLEIRYFDRKQQIKCQMFLCHHHCLQIYSCQQN